MNYIYGKIDTTSYIVGAITVEDMITAKISSSRYVTGAVEISEDNDEEEIEDG